MPHQANCDWPGQQSDMRLEHFRITLLPVIHCFRIHDPGIQFVLAHTGLYPVVVDLSGWALFQMVSDEYCPQFVTLTVEV